MIGKTEDISPQPEWTFKGRDRQVKPYFKPQLIEFGDLRTVTLGSSMVTTFESGGGEDAEYIYIP